MAESENLANDDDSGHFEIIDNAETRFSSLCANMIESTNTNTKTKVEVAWVAPMNFESTCIYIRAAVLQHRNVWFIDDGFLSKRICPEEIYETPSVDPCCACDEAKYEVFIKITSQIGHIFKKLFSDYFRKKMDSQYSSQGLSLRGKTYSFF